MFLGLETWIDRFKAVDLLREVRGSCPGLLHGLGADGPSAQKW